MLILLQAFQNGQLWKLVERERQKNAEMRAERDDARRRSGTDSQTPYTTVEASRLHQSISSTSRIILDEAEFADPGKRAERQRANTVTAPREGTLQRPSQPIRHHSEQQHPQTEVNPMSHSRDSRISEQNPFMLKMAIPQPFVEGQLPSPTTYSLPDPDVRNDITLATPVGPSSAPTSPVRRHSEGLHVQTSPNMESARDGARRNRLTSTSGLLPSPPIGTLPSLGDRTLSEQTDSSIATPMSEEMPSVPGPSHQDSIGHYTKENVNQNANSNIAPIQSQMAPQHIPHLTTALLHHTRCSIPSARVMQNASGKEVLCFIVRVTLENPANGQMLSWSVGKLLSAFASLDSKIRSILGGKREIKQAGIPSLPESKSWKDFAPSKIDQRKVRSCANPRVSLLNAHLGHVGAIPTELPRGSDGSKGGSLLVPYLGLDVGFVTSAPHRRRDHVQIRLSDQEREESRRVSLPREASLVSG